MSKHTIFLAACTIALGLSQPVLAQDTTTDTVVATVNGEDITIGHMIVLREGLPEQYQSLPDDVLFDGILEQLVQQTVLSQKAEKPGAVVELRLENERRSLLAGTAMKAMLDEALTDEALQAAYDEKFANAEPSKEFNASHILVETEDEANTLVTELQGGADFAELAKEKSTGPSGPNGGELGWFGAGMMVKEFEDAVMDMEVGAISAPVQTQFGWHVIRLNETRMQDAPPLADVRDELAAEMQQKVIEETLTKLTGEAEITRADLSTIDQSIIRNLDLVLQ
ncbi:MAG: peptidylprolyl isomerase [Paracoccaceae bacterium]